MTAATRVSSAQLSPTERRNPRSRSLDRLPVRAAVQLLLREEAKVTRVLHRAAAELAQAVKLVARAFHRGGRLFYVGAGTSGRLGVLDASECPPTFRSDPQQVQGIIAGGDAALRKAIEGAEDDAAAGGRALRRRGVGPKDVVIGITASGTTPFVWGALNAARERRARTVLLCFNPYLVIPRRQRPTVVLALDLGPEVLTGSTRLKCGTATKLVLNVISTLAMVQHGKVMSNLMVDVAPTNVKLRARAVRIVGELTGAAAAAAQAGLERHSWDVRKTVRALNRGGKARRA